MDSSNFDLVFNHILDREGTQFTDIPEDRGGPTKFGITQASLADYLGRPASKEDVKNMTQFTAKEIYRRNYWNVIRGDEIIHPVFCICFMDQAVNRGPASATRQIQRQLKLDPDGVVGPKTLKAINAQNDKQVSFKFICDTQNRYCDICVNDKSQIKFLNGWINRTQVLLEKLTGLKGAY